MTKVQYLFEMNKLLVRPTPEQSDYEFKNLEVLKSFELAVNKGFEQTLIDSKGKDPLSMNFSWFSNTMNGNVLAAFARLHPTLVRPTGRKNHCIIMHGTYECYIKKLNKGLVPSYNHSDTTEAMVQQMALPDQDPRPVIFLGYTLNKDNSMVTGVYAVCIKGSDRVWVTDITSLDNSSSGDTFATPKPTNPNSPDIIVTPKRKKKAN